MSAVRTVSIPPPTRSAPAPEPVRVEPAVASPARSRRGASATPAPTRRSPARKPGAAPVYLTAFALFAGFAAVLSARMVAGEDPALGLTVHPLAAAAVTPAPPLRKVIVTRRIRIDGLTAKQIRRRGVDRIVIVHRRAPASSAATTVASAAAAARRSRRSWPPAADPGDDRAAPHLRRWRRRRHQHDHQRSGDHHTGAVGDDPGAHRSPAGDDPRRRPHPRPGARSRAGPRGHDHLMTQATADTGADRRLELMGTRIRILVGPPARPGLADPDAAAAAVERFLRAYDRALSRFKPDSELCALNADPRAVVPASDLLRSAIGAALQAAGRSDGLVDPALLDDLVGVGYRESWDRTRRLDLRDALSTLDVPRRAASPNPASRWREISIDDRAGTITRPPGLRLDTGGTGKGHAADLGATLLDGYTHWAVDCGGDLRVGGDAGASRRVDVEHPFTGDLVDGFTVRDGAIATSGLSSRVWRGADGTVRHHLLDPATGEPAYTGLIAVTALAPTGVEAEALAKTALLCGPAGARHVLARHGGITFDEAGQPERIGIAVKRPVVRLRIPERRAA